MSERVKRRKYYYKKRIMREIKEAKQRAREGQTILVRARPVDFWCSDAGYHFDGMIWLYPDGSSEVLGTGYHCSWAKGVKYDTWVEAIEWLADWCAERDYKWGITAEAID